MRFEQASAFGDVTGKAYFEGVLHALVEQRRVQVVVCLLQSERKRKRKEECGECAVPQGGGRTCGGTWRQTRAPDDAAHRLSACVQSKHGAFFFLFVLFVFFLLT